MRMTAKGNELKAEAYAGTYVVVLAWDTLNGKAPARTDLLGYAIERAEFDLSTLAECFMNKRVSWEFCRINGDGLARMALIREGNLQSETALRTANQ